jgi:hypothetical protein
VLTDFGLQTHKVNMTISEESVAPLFVTAELDIAAGAPIDPPNDLFEDGTLQPTTTGFYSKGGTKYWLVGDTHGYVNLHNFNGTMIRRG